MGAKTASETSTASPGNPLPSSVSDIFHEFLFLRVSPPQTAAFKGYPTPPPRTPKTPAAPSEKSFTPDEKKPEKWVKKSQLDEISQSKWARFEKMVGQNFGDQLSKRLVLKTFRAHLKSVHPDTARSGAPSRTVNFATLVKIKDELIDALTQAL